MSRALILAAALLACGASAQTQRDKAITSGWSDAGTTAAGLALGAVETNPLGLGATLLKPLAIKYADRQPEHDRPEFYATIDMAWSAATANNLCVISVILTGGATAVFCPVIGVAWGLEKWSRSEDERWYAAWCKSEITKGAITHCLPMGPIVHAARPAVVAASLPRVSE